MYNFFLSYSRDANSDIIEELISSLEVYGFRIWYDKIDVILGANITQGLLGTLNQCKSWDGIILALDETYFRKQWCLCELQYAIENSLNCYPILIEITKTQVPIEYAFLKELNLCTVKNRFGISYAVNKVIARYLDNIKIIDNPVLLSSQTIILDREVEAFFNSNYQSEEAIFLCDNVALCLTHLLSEKRYILSQDEKILFNIVHQKAKEYILSGKYSRYDASIMIKATKKLICLFCKS